MAISEEVLRQRLKEIRKSLGLTEGDVAARLGKSYNSYVSKIESGQQKINIETINELSKVYNIDPINLFKESTMLLKKPKDFFSRAEFRTDAKKLSDETKKEIKQLFPFLRRLGKTMRALNESPLQISDFYTPNKAVKLRNSDDAKEYGRKVAIALREKYNLGLDPIADIQMFTWLYAKIPVCGVKLDKDCWGFYSKDQFDNPLILYSNDHDFKERNTFTIAHELGHHFYAPDEGCIDYEDIEASFSEDFANGFAQELLAPAASLNRLLEKHGLDVVSVLTPQHIVKLCTYYNVSFRMMAYVLYLQRKITNTEYQAFKALNKNELKKLGYPVKRTHFQKLSIKHYLQDRVAKALRKGALNTLMASEILNMTTSEVEALI